MGSTPVIHIYDPDGVIDGFMVRNMIRLTRGTAPIALHIDRDCGQVDTMLVGRDGVSQIWVAHAGQCGCP